MNNKNLEKIRHSLAHILAVVIQEMYPGVKFGIGPAIDAGFYYDFDFSKTKIKNISPGDLVKIEKKMRELIKKDVKFEKQEITKKSAEKLFKGQNYKLELVKDLENKKAIIYKTGSFVDLCKGPHIKSTKEIASDGFKLDKIAGAYWKGDEKNPMLTRIYGLAFNSKKELEDYIKKLEEIEKRDHRKIAKDLELYIISEQVGQGLPLWMPKGAILSRIIEEYVLKTYLREGYQLLKTPHIGNENLFNTSGHTDFYKDDMYSKIDIDGEKYFLKPMNCPFHMIIYKSKPRSYRDLPIRYTEFGTVYRYERSGTLSGLTRVRGFTQDDGHIICTLEQLDEEIKKAIILTKHILTVFGFKNFSVELSIRDSKNKQKYLGTDKDWKMAENALLKGIKEVGWKYKKMEGEAVFYGPKIDIKIEDALGRLWQISTIQLDFNLPKRFDISYIDSNGQKQTPFMIHRALLGSLERFIGLLIEHYNGEFPLWLAPIQLAVLPIGEKQVVYAKKIIKQLKEKDIRVELRDENETLSKKILWAETQKIPYLIIIGDREVKSAKISIRQRKKGNIGEFKIEEFIEIMQENIKNKT